MVFAVSDICANKVANIKLPNNRFSNDENTNRLPDDELALDVSDVGTDEGPPLGGAPGRVYGDAEPGRRDARNSPRGKEAFHGRHGNSNC